MSLDTQIDQFFQPVSDAIFSVIFYSVPFAGQDITLLLVWLASAAVFFTLYLGFVNVRYFCHAINVVRGKYDDKNDDGNINSFQALMASMSGTVGLGNIAGVAVAVSVGGPGAVFWMTVMGFLSMSTKFAEVTLGVKYRLHPTAEHPEKISGGPMYYLRDGLKKKGLGGLGKVLAIVFAVCCICGSIGGGNMFQANQAFQQAYSVTGGAEGFLADKGWMFGLFLAVITGVVIIGGIKSIASVSARLVPIMGVTYLLAGLVVIGMNFDQVGHAFGVIFSSAFSMEAGIGGLLGGLLVGVQRAAFSNESGLGSAPIVYAAARAKDPVTQGMASLLGPFIDTVVICNITALVIVISGAYLDNNSMEGVELTSRAMGESISWFPYVLSLTVFLFAYSTLITWYYLGQKALTFLIGQKDSVENGYKIFFCLCVVVGSSVQLDNLIAFTDAMILSMGIPNILGLYLVAPDIKADLKAYIARLKAESKS